jgi:hypothetical protein
MSRVTLRLYFLSAIALGVCVSLFAQSDGSTPPGHVKVIPAPASADEVVGGHVKALPAPPFYPAAIFDIENHKAAAARSIRLLSEDEMSREDHDLLANAESSIQERASVENLAFNEAGWTYHQLVCPAFPKHLFFRFTRDDGTRQMSMFSAAIPRDGNGRVHIIPIVRQGYSLFSPAPIGALTIASFNRIRAEEGEGASSDWLGTALCYAALAGANPKIAEPASKDDPELPAIMPPSLTISSQGGAVIRFADISVPSKPMQWSITFDARGKLIKATHVPAYIVGSGKRAVGEVNVEEAKP